MPDYALAKYNKCRIWISEARQERKLSWEVIKHANCDSEAEINEFLKIQNKINNWPLISVDDWYQIVDIYRSVNEASMKLEYNENCFTVSDIEENPDVSIPTSDSYCWYHYKIHLKNKAGFSDSEIQEVEKSCFETLQRLRLKTEGTGPIKGLVVGNVQSGKTANMTGLMAMAADNGWNMFIVLSGTIESLRNQTQKRFCDDLFKLPSDMTWRSLEHLSGASPYGERLCDINLKPYNVKLLTVCLKVKKRLEDLIDWLRGDLNQLKKLKILVIDDEADQASINTGKVDDEEENRKTINRLILNLVHCRDKDSISKNDPSVSVGAMNYVSYTATPYANCLNESGENTLYPQHFIHILKPSKKYIGPAQLFKSGNHDAKVLEIIRTVDNSEISVIKNIHKGMDVPMPKGLADSILWFIISAASMRYLGRKKPVSMLIHTSQKQKDHSAIDKLVRQWFIANKSDIPTLCEELYDEERQKFSKSDFREGYSEYSISDDCIPDYPPFDDIKPYIDELIQKISYIKMTDTKKPQFSKSIHLCIDNCKQNGINEDGEHVRLIYPDPDKDKLDYAAAFIVIGGNTLARGLTLEGLVSTYFQRNVLQADTLMQMARWFGYRIGYELFPRIWMTEDTQANFEYLADLDTDLREQLRELKVRNAKPLEFGLTLKTSPKARFLLTAKNKMQDAILADVDCSGMDTQMTTYSSDDSILENNIKVTTSFLSSLGNGNVSESCNACYWPEIDYCDIEKKFFDAGFVIPNTSRSFQDMDLISRWIDEQTEKNKIGKWTVIAAGIKKSIRDDDAWIMPNGKSIGKIERTIKSLTKDTLHIGVLSSKKDYIADVKEENVSSETWKEIKKGQSISNNYKLIREEAKLADTPLLVIYRISKDSKLSENAARGDSHDLNIGHDIIGIAMVIPGVRGRNSIRSRLTIKRQTEPECVYED